MAARSSEDTSRNFCYQAVGSSMGGNEMAPVSPMQFGTVRPGRVREVCRGSS